MSDDKESDERCQIGENYENRLTDNIIKIETGKTDFPEKYRQY